MKKLEIIIKPEKLESLKNILDDCEASGLMITPHPASWVWVICLTKW